MTLSSSLSLASASLLFRSSSSSSMASAWFPLNSILTPSSVVAVSPEAASDLRFDLASTSEPPESESKSSSEQLSPSSKSSS